MDARCATGGLLETSAGATGGMLETSADATGGMLDKSADATDGGVLEKKPDATDGGLLEKNAGALREGQDVLDMQDLDPVLNLKMHLVNDVSGAASAAASRC